MILKIPKNGAAKVMIIFLIQQTFVVNFLSYMIYHHENQD
jgi:hypothetical protein